MASLNNVSSQFLWLTTKNTNSHLLRRKNGVGDLSTSPLNPVGIQNPVNSGYVNAKHAGVTPHSSGNGFVLHHQGRKNSNKPAKKFSTTHIDHLKSADVLKFRSFVRHQLGRKNLSAAVIRKANRIAWTQNQVRKQAAKSVKNTTATN